MKPTDFTRSRAGFTLLEMLLVLTIAAIVSGVALQSVGRSLNATKIDRTAAVIASGLRQAKTTAARRRAPVRVSFDTAAKAMRVRSHVYPDSVYQTYWFTTSSQLPVTRLAATDTQVVFYPNGLADGSDTITVSATSEFQRRIVMNRAGQIRISVP